MTRDRQLLRDAMVAVRDDPAGPAAREMRLAQLHPGRNPAEIREAASYCRRALAEAEVCAEQVRQGRLTRDSAGACLAEQFPDLDMDQLRSALDLAIGASRL